MKRSFARATGLFLLTLMLAARTAAGSAGPGVL